MKAIVLTLTLAATAAFAGPYAPKAPVAPLPPPAPEPLFGPGFVLSPYALYLTPDADYDDTWGGGLAFDYYYNEYFGFGASAEWADVDGVGGAYNLNATLRYPVGHFAPYVIAGGGIENYNGGSEILGRAGAGLQVQFNPRFGLFGDWLYNFPGGGGGDDDFEDFQTLRFGLRIGF